MQSTSNRNQQLVYIAHIRKPTFIGVHMTLDMHTLTSMLIFSLWFFKVFKILYHYLFCKTLLLYIWSLIHLLVLRRNIFFTVNIYFKEMLFFKFYRKYLINISSYLKACVRYFSSIFYFSLNDSLSKTMKNVFYFI